MVVAGLKVDSRFKRKKPPELRRLFSFLLWLVLSASADGKVDNDANHDARHPHVHPGLEFEFLVLHILQSPNEGIEHADKSKYALHETFLLEQFDQNHDASYERYDSADTHIR